MSFTRGARFLVVVAMTVTLGSYAFGCASTTKPCSGEADVEWDPKLKPEDKGDQLCYQKIQKDGKFKNHGKYVLKYPDGELAIEGQFVDGDRHGVWTQYDRKGKKKRERYYEMGVEKTLAKPVGKSAASVKK